MNVFTVSILNEVENGYGYQRPGLKTNVKSTIYWFEIELGSIWRTGWHTPTIWDFNSYFNFSVLTILRATASVKNRECKTYLKSLWIAFKMKKILVFKVEVTRLKVLGSRTRQGREGGRGYRIQLCKRGWLPQPCQKRKNNLSARTLFKTVNKMHSRHCFFSKRWTPLIQRDKLAYNCIPL